MNERNRSMLWRLGAVALILGLFLLVVGGNCETLDRYGSDMPNMDQWDAEAVHLLVPWFRHDHFWREVFVPQNEHRVVLTKLQNWALTLIGGQWDARVQSLFNAVLHALIALAVWQLSRRLIRGAWRAVAFVAIAALYALPIAWQNLLGGFHSQQYWLILLSAGAIIVLPFARDFTGRWWLGVALAIVALGSMGSGFLAAAVVLVMVVTRRTAVGADLRVALSSSAEEGKCGAVNPGPLGDRPLPANTERGWWLTVLFTLSVVAFGWFTRHEVDYHEPLKAKSVHDFVFSVIRSLAWPLADHDFGGMVVWAPWACVVGLVCGSVLPRKRTDWILRCAQNDMSAGNRGGADCFDAGLVLFGLGAWVWLQILATAYARGVGGGYPVSRYFDTLMFGIAVNAIALGWILSGVARRSLRWVAIAVGAAWCGAVGTGLVTIVRHNLSSDLPAVRTYFRGAEAHLRAYLAEGDVAELVSPIPYLDAPRMVQRVSPPEIQRVLPQSVRPPVTVAAASGDGVFQRNFASQRRLETEPQRGMSPETQPLPARPTWGSYTAAGIANTGVWKSEPVTAPLGGWLKFETAGNLGEPGVSLELDDAATGERIAAVVPSHVPDVSWRSVYVRAPQRPFTIVAKDEDPTRWMAFSAPVEMTRFSYAAWRVVKNGRLIAECGLALALLAGAAFLAAGVRRREA